MEHLQHVARSIQISHPKSFQFLHEIDQDRPTKFTQTIALQALHPPSLFNQLSHFNKASSSADPVQNAIQAFSECHSNVIAKTSCINVQESVHKYVSMTNKNYKSLACCSFQLFPVLRVLDIASQRHTTSTCRPCVDSEPRLLSRRKSTFSDPPQHRLRSAKKIP